MADNPFAVVSPEELTAEQADQLFVEMHSDYPEITRQGNTLVTGARGCGKSMLIRCSLPDFLMIRNQVSFSELPYLSVNVSIKKTTLNLVELQKLDNLHMPYLINEHFLTLHVLMYSFLCLSKVQFEVEKYDEKAYRNFFDETYNRFLRLAGCNDTFNVDYSSPSCFFNSLYQHLVNISYVFTPYLTNLFNVESPNLSYTLPLFSFSRFIVPVFTKMMTLPCFPNGKPILIFIDDADNLSKIQTEILNSWIASRTQPTISLKVFAQLGLYKTFLTSSGILVESPHDYQELNISSKYTTRFSNPEYYNKAIHVLAKRLQLAGYMCNINEESQSEIEEALKKFFPTYKKQDEEIAAEIKRIIDNYKDNGRGYRKSDDVRRYAIPNYIRRLAGPSKSKPSFRYAGIENIIHLSSGIIRYLLDAVAKMYDVTAKLNRNGVDSDGRVAFIPTEIQNQVLREKADFYLFNELPKSNELSEYNQSSKIAITDNPRSTTEKLANLINSMGKTFQEILLSGTDDDPFSGRSERKVFSIALSNPEKTSDELKEVFRLGVRLGFLHESFIGNKDGDGRTYLYILNRCFAPIFTLDPSGFQGYLFMTNEDLTKAIHTGKRLRVIVEDTSEHDENLRQLSLFDYWED